jgi:hypothetical protein
MKALLVMLSVSFTAYADGVQLADFEGKGAARVRKQIESKLCRHTACVGDDAEASTVVHGKISAKGGKKLLELEVRDADGALVLSQRVPLSGKSYATKVDKLVRSALSTATKAKPAKEAVANAKVEPAEEAGEQAKAEDPPAVKQRRGPVASASASVAVAPVTVAPAATQTESSPATNEVIASASEPRPEPVKRFLWLAAGMEVQSRHMIYQGLATPEVVAPREIAIMPRVDLALFPWARDGMGGLGVLAGFASTVTSGTTAVTARQLDAALAFGLRFGGAPVWVRPEVGFRWHLLDGQGPSTDYRGLRAGLTLEAGLGPVHLYGGASYLAVLSSQGELSQRYFTRDRVSAAVDAQLGLAVKVIGKLELTLSGRCDVYFHALNAEPGDLYVAQSAVDSYLSAAVGARLSF